MHADALGTTRLLTSTAGATTDTYLFDAWGNAVSSTGSTVNPFRWVGRSGYYTDSTTGLIYVRARMYAPTIARWVSVDPLFRFPQGWGFIYGLNGSLENYDPSGLICIEEKHYCGPVADGILAAELNYADTFWNKHIKAWDSSLAHHYWYRQYIRWEHMAKIGFNLDWTGITSEVFEENGVLKFCPTKKCMDSYNICGICVHDHFIGNIMFGYWMRLHGFFDTSANLLAELAQLVGPTKAQGFDKPWDVAGYELGRLLLDSPRRINRNSLCDILLSGSGYSLFMRANDSGISYRHCERCPAEVENGGCRWLKECKHPKKYVPF
ncbi:MAG: hypothetical protein JNL58_31350 [Planctomyces sp.]|nr:hypothetical protein [Planctomyces sp.]